MPPAGASPPGRLLALAGAAALAGALLYAGTLSNGFVYDDLSIAQKNPLARDPSNLSGILGSHYWAPMHERGNLYRPLTIWSLALNHAAGDGGPAGYHAVNALLHGTASALVVLVAAALGLGGGGALAAGLLFAFHPVHVEAVAPVVGRSELLAAVFVLAGWLLHLGARPGTGRVVHLRRAGAALCLGLGLLSKEHAAVLPALVLAGDLTARRERGWRRSLPTLALMALAGLAVLALRARAVPGLPAGDPLGEVFGGIDPWTRIMTATGVLGRYLWLLAFPLHLSADYSYHQIPLITSPADPLFLLSALLHLGLLAAGLWLAWRGRLSGLGILVYLLALLPVSNLPLSVGTVMGERLLYLPSAGAFLAVAALARELAGPRPSRAARRWMAGALAFACLLYGGRVVARVGDWKDQLTLFRVTVRTSPRSAKAWYNLATAESGRGNLRAAAEAYRRAVEIKPDMAEAHRNLGLDLLRLDRPGEALTHLETAARLDPEIPDIYSDMGIAWFRTGRLDRAEEAFRREIARQPGGARARYNLGTVLLEAGRPAEAVAPLSAAVRLDPGDPDARVQLGLALSATGRHEQALEVLRQVEGSPEGLSEALLTVARRAGAAGRAGVASRARALAGRGGSREVPQTQ